MQRLRVNATHADERNNQSTPDTMDRPYDNIPRQGEHLGRDLDEEPTTNVRAQEAVKPTAHDSTAGGIIQLTRNESEGHYRIRRWADESAVTLEEGYSEIRSMPEGESIAESFEAIPSSARYVVFENLESGQVYVENNFELTDNWSAEGRFDQVTIFDDEEAAETYAKARQEAG